MQGGVWAPRWLALPCRAETISDLRSSGRYGINDFWTAKVELAPVSLDTTLSTGTEKEWPS